MSSSSTTRVWDPSARRWIRYSSSKRSWIDVESGRRVSAPPKPQGPAGAASTPSARDVGSRSKTAAPTSRSSAPNAQAVTAQMGSLNVRPQTTTQGSSVRSTAPYKQTVRDSKTGLQTRWEVSETTPYRDPGNASSNRGLNVKRIRQVDDKRDNSSVSPGKNYKVYRVIEVALVPPEDIESSNVSRITPTDSGINIRNRRFVIVREVPERNSFEALAIKTYNGRGVGAPGVIKSHHSIIYTTPQPRPQTDELPGRANATGQLENGMQPQAIRVAQYDRGTALDPMCRLDYADRYEFDWGVPNMKLFGRVHEDSHAALFLQYNSVWQTIQSAVQGHLSGSTPAASPYTSSTSGAGKQPGRSNTAATSASSTRGGSATSAVTPASLVGAQGLITRFGTQNSGTCTESEMQSMITYLSQYAAERRLTQPAATSQQVQELARNASKRATYFQSLRSRWQQEQQHQQEEASEEESEDEDDSD